MKLLVSSRRPLVDPDLAPGARAVLLEGVWPDRPGPRRWSLDESIDGRFDWIDAQAEACAAEVIAHDPAPASPMWQAALELRYHLVKLLRVPAFFAHVCPLDAGDEIEFAAQLPADADYADLLGQIAAAAGARLGVRPHAGPPRAAPPFPANGRARRWLGRLADRFAPRLDRAGDRVRVVCCGNPRVLNPVARALAARGAALWWLYDRFAVRSFLAWRARGIGQLVCNAADGAENRLEAVLPDRLEAAGVDLAPAVRRFAADWLGRHGARQTRLLDQIEAHFRRVRPHVLVLDEDATPPARAAVAAARRARVRSLVIQHGAPCCRFGFAPLAADQICVWGRSARSQLLRWGVPAPKILLTGSPYHEQLRMRLARFRFDARRKNRLLLLATVPPRDERPDAVALNLTRASYAALLREALEGIRRVGCGELIVKLHPRAGDDPLLCSALAERPRVPVRVLRDARLEELLTAVDCVLSVGSSAGIDATLSGVPVIQLLPRGASDFLSREPWGLSAIARTAAELEHALRAALTNPARPALEPDVFLFTPSPSARIADEILRPAAPIPASHSSFILHPSSSLHSSFLHS